jgi:hypothetical protein
MSALMWMLLTVAALVMVTWVASRDSITAKFWPTLARMAAVAAMVGLGWLIYGAGRSDVVWWSSPAGVTLLTLVVGAIAPVTAFVLSWAKLQLEAQRQAHDIRLAEAKQAHDLDEANARQKHEIESARAHQEHAITTDYLSRTLSSELPLATRHQLLRFLATPPKDPSRLQVWAKEELRRIDAMFERYTRDLEAQHEAIAKAKDVTELRLAEAKLKALTVQGSASRGEPTQPTVTPEALRAGFFQLKNLGEVSFPAENLDKAQLLGAKMAGSDFLAR